MSYKFANSLSSRTRIELNKFVKLVHLVGFIIKKAHENINFLAMLFQLQRLDSVTLHG